MLFQRLNWGFGLLMKGGAPEEKRGGPPHCIGGAVCGLKFMGGGGMLAPWNCCGGGGAWLYCIGGGCIRGLLLYGGTGCCCF